MIDIKKGLVKTISDFKKTVEVDTKAVKRLKKVLEEAQKESAALKTEKG